ncbi:MAG: RNA-binding domain-containing protein, partial [Candidatus Methanomethylophilaceae archaeon]
NACPGMTLVSISAEVNPSESEDSVRKAVLNIFPDAELERTEEGFRGTAPGTDCFSELIRKQKILDAARATLIKGAENGKTRFLLNKQAAFAGKVSFTDGRAVLGPIKVVMEDGDIHSLIDRISPYTIDGKEVKE